MSPKLNLTCVAAICTRTGSSLSGSRRASSRMVLRGMIASIFGLAPSFCTSHSARRWPSVATARTVVPSTTSSMPFR